MIVGMSNCHRNLWDHWEFSPKCPLYSLEGFLECRLVPEAAAFVANCDLSSDSMADKENPRTSKSLELKIVKEYLKINNPGETTDYTLRFWKSKAYVSQINLKDKKEDLENDRLVSFTSIPDKKMEQRILDDIFMHLKDKKVAEGSQQVLIKGILCLDNLVTLLAELTDLVDEKRPVDVFYPDLTASHHMLIDTLINYGLEKWTKRYTENWSNC
ncbi:hypothetical protein WISP_94972 [Willisornis vidua]|uniref:Uncharacterized protein n=1 Tax=Willisornis vidua TaxID=1566151 RepID=A0ABQ9D0D3_9PASS|nr:hypothetical protein WISP_94972 [Willisornis vidua]